MDISLLILFDPIAIFIVFDDESSWKDGDDEPILIVSFYIAKFIFFNSEAKFIELLQLASLRVALDGKSVFGVVHFVLPIFIFSHELSFLVLKQFLTLIVDNFIAAFVVAMYSSVLVHNHSVPLFIYVFLIRGVSNHFKAMLVIEYFLPLFLSHFITSLVVRLTVNKHVAIRIESHRLAVDDSDLVAIFVCPFVVAIFVDLHFVSILVIQNRVIEGIPFYNVPVMVVLNWLPSTLLALHAFLSLCLLSLLVLELKVFFLSMGLQFGL